MKTTKKGSEGMKRRIVSLFAASFVAMGSVAYASPQVRLKDAQNDIITVVTDAKKGEALSVLITNPGYEREEATDNGDAISFYKRFVSDRDNFSVDIPMYDNCRTGGGEFEVTVSTADGYESAKFRFYFAGEKERIITLLNEEEDITPHIKRAYEAYSLADLAVFETTGVKNLADILSSFAPFENDVGKMYEILTDALCLASYREGNEKLIQNGTISFVDALGLEGTPIYEDYLNELSQNGKDRVNEGLLGVDYEAVANIKEAFEELVLVNLITNYRYMGIGHVSEFMGKYSEEYESAGIYKEKITQSKKENDIYQAMVKSDATSLSDLKKIVTSALKPANTSGGSGSGGGGGGGTISSEAVQSPLVGAVTEPLPQGAGYVPNLEITFTDLEGYEWATQAISNLCRMGAINGKSKEIFAPSDLVTRGEFTKMLILAFYTAPTETEAAFADATGWELPYVTYGVKKGIVNGVSKTSFAPDDMVTREQAASIVARALVDKGYADLKEGKKFSDSDSVSDWAKESVDMLSGAKIILGRGKNEFCPKENMTRAEAAKIIYAATELLKGDAK